jgi:hypothetical protein
MAVRVAGFAFRRGAEYARHIVKPFDVRFGCEIQIASVGLRFAGESVFQILLCLGAFKAWHDTAPQ